MDASQAASLSSEDSVIITVVLADDDRTFSAALQEVIVTAPQLRLVGLAGDATEAVALAERHQPDVAVLDVRMPGGGVAAAREMRRRSPATSIIALSAYEDRDNVASMVGAGAQAYLVKGRVTSDDVVRAIRQAAGRA
jgi:DNA-binding NarL/FixJ family response regulator